MIILKKIYPNFEPAHELLACFNDQGNPIEPRPREVVHTKPYTIWHGVSNVWLLNNRGDILCSKRSNLVSGNPNKWQTYFGGHVKAGSDFLKTAQEELNEEIGLNVPDNDLNLVESGQREDIMHLYKMYAILFNDSISKLKFTDGEVVVAKWFRFNDYQKMKKFHPDQWCNGMSEEQYNKALQQLNIIL